MDSLDLLQQNAYQNLPPLLQNQYQNHHHQKQQQQLPMNIDSFQDKSSDSPEGQTDLQFCEGVRQDDSNGASSNQSNSELAQEGSDKDIDLHSQSVIYLTGQTTEIENTLQGLDGAELSGVKEEDNDNIEEREEEVDECDDEAAFVALCTDASSVLNKHDPSRRYYINKLYQPMHGHQDETPLEEQDDEYLLYQELRFLESAAQESTDDRQRVQLTKILEDDEGDEDVDHLIGNNPGEDPLDRLQLTTIIEAFESFPSSPLIETCHNSDPLVDGICNIDDQCQDKPDSTRHGDSPIRSNNTNSYIDLAQDHQQFECEHGDLQFTQINHDEDQNPDFSSVTSANSLNRNSHHNHLHHHHNLQHQQLDDHQQYNQQISPDISSENNCFQQVSSTFMQSSESIESSSSCPLPRINSDVHQQQHHQTQEDHDNKTHCKNVERQPKKRDLQQVFQQDYETRTLPTKAIKNRTKKRRRMSVEEDTKPIHSCNENSVSPVDGVTSSMINQIEIARYSNSDSDNSTNKIDGYQHKSITIDDIGEGDEESMSMEEGSISNGGRGHHISKYRRRTANARERIRMREINQAFEKLKKVVPIELIQQSASGDESDQTSVSGRRGGKSSSNNVGQQSDSQSVKLTKITTLRLAVSYIAKLSEVLSQHPEGGSSGLDQQSRSSTEDSSTASAPLMGNLKTKSGESIRGRKRRSRSSSKKSVGIEKVRATKTKNNDNVKESDISLRNSSNSYDLAKKGSLETMVEPTIMMNQANQRRPILITNNVLNGGLQQQTATFLPIQQHDSSKQGELQSHNNQQQFTYAHCGQQPLTISQTNTSNGQDRTFVTPVAVAILGIPTAANNRGLNEHQGLQLLGIQNAQQLQQRTQHIQTNSAFSLITQQPQQVAFTLDDINGVSVLRLANTQNHAIGSSQQQTIQFQPGRSTIIQQPQVLTTTQATGYNYATTYRPVHISQVQSTNMANVRPLTAQPQQQQQTATVQFRTCNSVNGRTQETHLVQFGNDLRAAIGQQNITISDNHITTTTANSNQSINTGTNSDCRNFGISPNMIAQHLNNNNSNINNNINSSNNNINNINNSSSSNSNAIKTTQFKLQQSNCSEGQFLSSNNMMPQGTRIFQAQQISRCNAISSNQTQANLIYINPTNISSSNNLPAFKTQLTIQQQSEQNSNCNRNPNSNINIDPNNSKVDSLTSNGHYEQMKFVTQFSSQLDHQDKNIHANEANIRQLVASLATSIQPNGDQFSKTKQDEQAGEQQQLQLQQQQHHQQQQQQQRQQPKRTYRFHNYDGNMITNHLYNNNHDKTGHHQQEQSSKRSVQQQQQQPQLIQLNQSTAISATTTATTTSDHSTTNGVCQRSRQNSLSSTCSTNSCSSSSLTSLSTASPQLSMMVKSPSIENGSSDSSSNTTLA